MSFPTCIITIISILTVGDNRVLCISITCSSICNTYFPKSYSHGDNNISVYKLYFVNLYFKLAQEKAVKVLIQTYKLRPTFSL